MDLEKIILNICNYEDEFFLRKVNVQGIGFGYKRINGCTILEKVIQVYVSKKIAKNCLNQDNLIPRYYKGIKTDVIETGIFTVKDCVNNVKGGLTSRVRPVFGGYSISPGDYETASTFGALVTDGQKFYMLGVNHSLAQKNKLPLGYPIIQPGGYDRGISKYDTVARLSKFITLEPKTASTTPVNYVDCAIAEVITPGTVSSEITFIGKTTGVIKPSIGLEVQCACRTSTYFTAKIMSYGATITIEYEGLGSILLKNQIFLDEPIQQGDSGALILSLDKKAVGLGIASVTASSKCISGYSICNNINIVLEQLKVTLV